MMSLRTIEVLADEAAARAAKTGLEPYQPWDEVEVEGYGASHGFPFPNIGSHRPRGWRLVETLFCDATGMGADWEPALTVSALRAKLIEHQREGREYGYAIIEEGQFQLTLGVFECVRRSRRKAARSSTKATQ